MDTDQIRAQLVPETHAFSGSRTQPLIRSVPPQITSTLSETYTPIILLNRALSFLTWTNEDPYYNCVVVATYALIVVRWDLVSHWLLPTLFVFMFCSMVWLVKSIYMEPRGYEDNFDASTTTGANTNDPVPPTIEEILDGLTNFATRCKFLASPAMRYSKTPKTHLIIMSILATPLHYWVLVQVLGLRVYVLLVGVFCLTFNSSWCMAVRQLVWRSNLIRQLATLLTGFQFPTQNITPQADLGTTGITFHSPVDTRIVSPMSPNSTAHVVEFELFENERRWLAVGWSDSLMPLERQHYTNSDFQECFQQLDQFEFPELDNSAAVQSGRWKWIEESWKPDLEFCLEKNPDGWVYYDHKWSHPTYVDSLSRFTRARRLTRKALLLTNETVQE